MTDTELNIKIAEKRGWKGIVPQFAIGYAPWRPKSYSEACMGDIDSVPQDPIPDYCNDLNAIAEAEKTLNRKQKNHYTDELNCLCGACYFNLLTATARQRAEAFARVFNLI